MAQQIINVGAAPNDGTGDPLQTAFTKSNANFTELYAAGGGAATPPQGRLTLQTATPVMTTTQAAKATIYYTPYVGNQIVLYDGTNMLMTPFAELSVATTDTTKNPAAIGASKVNDWFVWNDAGTLRISHGPDWTSDTGRSAGTALVMVNGIWLNNAAITNGPAAQRGTYVGTTRSNASSQLDWIYGAAAPTAGFFGVWNCYNRILVGTFVGESANSWTYATGTWRAANGSANMRVTYVAGLAEDVIDVVYSTAGRMDVGTGAVGIGVDLTTAFSGLTGFMTVSGFSATVIGSYIGIPGVGVHFVSAIEIASGGTITLNGDGGLAYLQLGLTASLRM